jgi:hypothetical protein
VLQLRSQQQLLTPQLQVLQVLMHMPPWLWVHRLQEVAMIAAAPIATTATTAVEIPQKLHAGGPSHLLITGVQFKAVSFVDETSSVHGGANQEELRDPHGLIFIMYRALCVHSLVFTASVFGLPHCSDVCCTSPVSRV